jgi:hypothetical protein
MTTSKSINMANRQSQAIALLTYISEFNGYNPPREEESVDNVRKIVDDIINAAAQETSAHTNFIEASGNRQVLVHGDNGSIRNTLQNIRSAVESQYGKKSNELATIAMILRRLEPMRAKKAVEVTPITGSEPPQPVEEPAAIRSKSTQTFGNFEKVFRDIITALKEFGTFKPSNPNLAIDQLDQQSATFHDIMVNVASSTKNLKMSRTRQRELLDELAERAGRIKASVKSQYGKASDEYILVKSIRI